MLTLCDPNPEVRWEGLGIGQGAEPGKRFSSWLALALHRPPLPKPPVWVPIYQTATSQTKNDGPSYPPRPQQTYCQAH